MADDDDVPPLEDLSHAFKSLATTAGSATPSAAGIASPSPVPTTAQKTTGTESLQKDPPVSTQAKSTSTSASSGRQGQASFGGMRSGFLTPQQKPKPKQSATSTTNSDAEDKGLPFIRANPEAAARSLRLDEVQDSMRSSTSSAADGILSGDRSWITDDLLGKIESNPDLLRRLADPRMSAALAKFQANPAAAMAEFASDAEVQAFLKDFAVILGDHFTQIAEKQEKEAAASKAAIVEPPPDPEVTEVLSRPGVREALTNADVQRWLSMAKTDPDRAQALLRASRDPVFQGRIRLLFENGLLGIAK